MITTKVPTFLPVARRIAKVTSQVGPPAVKWSRGTARVTHSNSLSSGQVRLPTNVQPPATALGWGVGEGVAGGAALGARTRRPSRTGLAS